MWFITLHSCGRCITMMCFCEPELLILADTSLHHSKVLHWKKLVFVKHWWLTLHLTSFNCTQGHTHSKNNHTPLLPTAHNLQYLWLSRGLKAFFNPSPHLSSTSCLQAQTVLLVSSSSALLLLFLHRSVSLMLMSCLPNSSMKANSMLNSPQALKKWAKAFCQDLQLAFELFLSVYMLGFTAFPPLC